MAKLVYKTTKQYKIQDGKILPSDLARPFNNNDKKADHQLPKDKE